MLRDASNQQTLQAVELAASENDEIRLDHLRHLHHGGEGRFARDVKAPDGRAERHHAIPLVVEQPSGVSFERIPCAVRTDIGRIRQHAGWSEFVRRDKVK